VHQARLFGRCEPTTGIEPFDRLVAQVMTTQPYASAERVFWVVDNGSSHRGRASVERLEGAWPNLRLIHLPIHASWLNQVEIYFSVVQRKVLAPNDFLAQRFPAFCCERMKSEVKVLPGPLHGF
jgi:DDE superfamily endonuclease